MRRHHDRTTGTRHTGPVGQSVGRVPSFLLIALVASSVAAGVGLIAWWAVAVIAERLPSFSGYDLPGP